MPFVGSLLGQLSRHAFKRADEEMLFRSNKALENLRSGGKVLPPHEIKQRLASILASDFAAWRNNRPDDRFVVMIDEYESALDAGGATSLFRVTDFDDMVRELVEHCHATLFVFFSREKLRWGAFDDSWREILSDRQHLLGGLAKNDAHQFLKLAGVHEAEIRAAMVEGALAHDDGSNDGDCYPIMLDMQIELYHRLQSADKPVAAEDFQIDGNSFGIRRQKLLSRLLRRYPQQLEYTLRRLAVARRFDEGVYKFLTTEFRMGPVDAWAELQALSILQQGAVEGVYTFHNVIREGLLADGKTSRETHAALAEHFKRVMVPPAGEKVGAMQAAAAAEAFYHLASIDAGAANAWWAEAERGFRGSLLERFVEDIDRASVDLAARASDNKGPEYAKRLYALGKNLDAQGRFTDAEEWYRKALTIMVDAGEGATLRAASVLQSLGIALDYQKNRHADAYPLLKGSLDILESILKPDDRKIAIGLTAMGTNLVHQGRYIEAEPIIRKALIIMTKSDHASATIHHNLGLCLGNQEGRLSEAVDEHRKGLRLREQFLGPDHYKTGESLSYLSFFLDKQKRYLEAEQAIRRALEIAKKTYGLNHRETADCFSEFGRTLYNQGRFEESEQQHSQALAIRERTLGPADPDTAASVGHVGWAMYRAGKYKGAVLYLRRALEIRDRVLGSDHQHTRRSAEMLLEAEGRLKGLRATVVVCGSNEVANYSPRDFSDVVIILDPTVADPTWPEGWSSVRKLFLRFHDATAVTPSAVMFGPEHLECLLSFVEKEPAVEMDALLVCGALGISRSVACAAIIQAHLAPHLAGIDVFREILKTREVAWPNLHIVELGDARLARSGDLIAGANAVYRYQLQKHPEWKESLTLAGRGREVEAAARGGEISF